jgi:hypothetical protein
MCWTYHPENRFTPAVEVSLLVLQLCQYGQRRSRSVGVSRQRARLANIVILRKRQFNGNLCLRAYARGQPVRAKLLDH